MKKTFALIFALILALSSAACAEDEVYVQDFYISTVNGNLYVFEFIGTHLTSGQVGIGIIDYDIPGGYSVSRYIPDGHFSITDSVITIREKVNSNKIFAHGTVGYDYIDLTFDGVNYYHFVHFPFNSASASFSDPFTDIRPLFDDGFTVPAGLYVVGEDIPAGSYSFSSSSGCNIDTQLNNFHLFTLKIMPGETFRKYVLKDHQQIIISGGSVVMKTYTGLFD